jgi:hypothetical protein
MRRYSRSYLFVIQSAAVKMLKPPAAPARNFARIRRPSLTLSKALVLRKKSAANPLALSESVTAKGCGYCHGINVLGSQFDKLLNVTLCYPENNQKPFYDMLSGRLTRIVVRVN